MKCFYFMDKKLIVNVTTKNKKFFKTNHIYLKKLQMSSSVISTFFAIPY